MSPELENALKEFEQGALDRVIQKRRPEDFAALRQLVTRAGADPNDRQRAIHALGRWGDPSVVDAVIKVLRSPRTKESHRITAIEALGRLRTQPAREAVESFANDPSAQIRKFVVQALKRIGDAPAQATLRKIAREDDADWVRDLALRPMKSVPARRPRKR